MRESQRTTTVAGSDEEWLVEGPTRRVVWSGETGECAECETSFELSSGHYYVILRPSSAVSADANTREFAFCSDRCAEAWLRP